MAAKALEQPHDVLADERFAAGDAQLADALGDEGRAQPVELLQRQQVLLRQERHVLRHAVDAAEIAAVGDGDAQIGDGAAERIDHLDWRPGLRRAGQDLGHGISGRFADGVAFPPIYSMQRGKSESGSGPFSAAMAMGPAILNPKADALRRRHRPLRRIRCRRRRCFPTNGGKCHRSRARTPCRPA